MKLKITASIANEWMNRGIGDVIPALEDIQWGADSIIEVDDKTADEIRADCAFYINPNAVDASVGERAAYRALLKQIESEKAKIQKPPAKKGQLELPMKHFPFQEYLGAFKRIRKAIGPKIAAIAWTQLTLKLHLRKLYKIPKIGFIWTRPDGKQFACRNMRALVARIMDYDGHLLNSVLRMT